MLSALMLWAYTRKRYSCRLFSAIVIVSIIALCFIFIQETGAYEISLAWDKNPEPAVSGYIVYYGQARGNYTKSINVGNAESYVVSGLDGGTTYFFAIKAYSNSGDESDFSGEISYSIPANILPMDGHESSSSGGGGCFIATAAYGSYLAPEVILLREFRDSYLLTNLPGRIVVETYYRYSPVIAHQISQYEGLRTITRWGLTPIVWGIKYPIIFFIILLALSGTVYSIMKVRVL